MDKLFLALALAYGSPDAQLPAAAQAACTCVCCKNCPGCQQQPKAEKPAQQPAVPAPDHYVVKGVTVYPRGSVYMAADSAGGWWQNPDANALADYILHRNADLAAPKAVPQQVLPQQYFLMPQSYGSS